MSEEGRDKIAEAQTYLREAQPRLQKLADRAERMRQRLASHNSLIHSMERLAEVAKNAAKAAPSGEVGYAQDDGFYVSDGWEIALINAEGK